jgi:hypothetical protein
MKEDICTIPVNEVFAIKDGCPICRMRKELEGRALDFVLGAAMMETDVRHETNRLGFCPDHFSKMKESKNRLSFALILESHLIEIQNAVFDRCKPNLMRNPVKSAQESARVAADMFSSCYICERVERSLDKELNTFYKMWKDEQEFRESVATQPYYCMRDYALLLKKGEKLLDKKRFAEFYDSLSKVTSAGLSVFKDDMSAFCKMFDYHNNGTEFGNLRDAVKRAIAFLTGKWVE